MNKLVEIEHIMACYGDKTVLPDVSLTLYEHEFLGVIGPNGGGKTTLLKVILGLLPPVKGTIRFYQDGAEVSSLKMGYLPQMSQIDRKFPIHVREVIASGLASEKPRLRPFSKDQNRRIDEVAQQMGIEDLMSHPIGELSGGQLQRVLLGRSIVSRPKLLVLDEPNSYLDKLFEPQFHQLLKDINQESAIILVSHDVEAVRSLASRCLVIENGKLKMESEGYGRE